MPAVPPRYKFGSILYLQFGSAPLQPVKQVTSRMMSFIVPRGPLVPTCVPKMACGRLRAASRNESNLASISLNNGKPLFPLLSGVQSQLKASIRKNMFPHISASTLDSPDPPKYAGIRKAPGRSSSRVIAQSKSDTLSDTSDTPIPLSDTTVAESEAEKQHGIWPNANTTCTADELHYVDSGPWKLALWRYLPPPNAPKRKHPVLMLCGVANNALGYDLDPDVSLARFLKNEGFESWILEVRGAGFSHLAENEAEAVQSLQNRESSPHLEEESDSALPLTQTMATLRSGTAEGLLDSSSWTAQGQAAETNGVRISEVKVETERVEAGSESDTDTDTDREEVGERKGVKRKRRDSEMVLVSGSEPQASRIAATAGQLREQLGKLLEEGLLAALASKYAEIGEITRKLLEAVSQRSAISDRVADVCEQVKGLLEQGSKTAVASRLGDLRAAIAKVQEDRRTGSVPEKIADLTDRLTEVLDEAQKSALTDRISGMMEKVTRVLGDGQRAALAGRIRDLMDGLSPLQEEGQRSAITARIADLRSKMEGLLEESQTAASPQVKELGSRFQTLFSDTSKSLAMLRKYDWDFDTLLNQDLPAAMAVVLEKSHPEDGKILGVGHSMGGIMLLSRLAVLGTDSQLQAAVTVASAMQYGMSNSSLKLALPLTTPARLASIPVVPLGAMARTALPLIVRPPYTLAYIGQQVSAHNMMNPLLLHKLFTHNFSTIPVKLLLQLATLFQDSGLRDRSGKIVYARGLRDCKVPVLALAGNADLICPPIAVTETLKMLPEESVEYRLFGGGSSDRNYAHFDLLVGSSAKTEVFPVILNFLVVQDGAKADNGCVSSVSV